MKQGYLTLLIGILFLMSAIVFIVKHSWLFTTIFIIVGVMYIVKYFKMKKNGSQ
ncbi:DUF308 domain-containing protein [Staphylococcus agnetis]|uniref:DUF308 domain-containing protein n=1 Tax=Staphylococcus agnetis TaxID=985762 RepID=UPI000CD0028C|nr:DUF308 domain-containing protein [Staphylococcus agnetis]MBY7664683.1 DUF308 domain-containing protein [Staphylococcus agnetis]NJH67648.1 hypothetical protein [Staphylococcus agnetis]NJH78611.1 hypothetical protein [Staphylococcus agnetis]PNY87473.1 hypothetical protein CD172_02080 [Staphylococcus agnetis]PTH65298.1 hypothetical protein BU582_11230 [Staphylococcus agnetis]